jgi:exonuclease VII small subunit
MRASRTSRLARFAPTLLGAAALSFTLSLGGCALFDGSVQRAKEIAELRKEQVDEAVAALDRAGRDLEQVLKAYEDAKAQDNLSEMERLKGVMVEAVARYKSAEEAAKLSVDLFNTASKDFADAKGAADYLGTILGYASLLLGGLGIGGGGMRLADKKRIGAGEDATAGLAAVIEGLKLKADDSAWAKEKADHINTLSPAARNLIDQLRP